MNSECTLISLNAFVYRLFVIIEFFRELFLCVLVSLLQNFLYKSYLITQFRYVDEILNQFGVYIEFCLASCCAEKIMHVENKTNSGPLAVCSPVLKLIATTDRSIYTRDRL